MTEKVEHKSIRKSKEQKAGTGSNTKEKSGCKWRKPAGKYTKGDKNPHPVW